MGLITQRLRLVNFAGLKISKLKDGGNPRKTEQNTGKLSKNGQSKGHQDRLGMNLRNIIYFNGLERRDVGARFPTVKIKATKHSATITS